ncbi:tRNA pseudouridine(55) synthase TruB [Persicobacter psychrovividus]|uniref:tRNA pseudouridine synthase B n=1 Tax=Persicobacter psychrovividus TaxID=387638 RepID=A0ABM7VEN2_9BACT|nr:tRNA pseudouridine synthase B [Persicobacter psychrovividus]
MDLKDLDFLAGQVLLIDKPKTWTSFDVVGKLRNLIKIKKIGHAGTLDPLATGLLILCTGKMTKQIESYQAQEKEYTGTITLGQTTPSYDAETEVDAEKDIQHLTAEMVHEAVPAFLGEIEQIPPMYSAIKVNGQRLYKAARKGKTVEVKARQVTIHEFEITNIDFPKVDFRIVCSKGTYIRSIAHDLGQALNVGGHLAALRRTRIGDFKVEDARTVEDFIAAFKKEEN